MVDAHDAAHKFLSKNRWRTKILGQEEPHARKPESKARTDADVSDFLRPSTEKAQAHKEAAAAAFLAGAKPRIDVARAQRWPGASDIVSSATGSPHTGAMKKSRKKAVSVSFVRTQPDIIGEGGDECEEPSIEVSRRKAHSLGQDDRVNVSTHQDDLVLASSHVSQTAESANRQAVNRGSLTRTLTSHHELSPELQKKMEMGRITTHASPPPLPPRGLGPMGLGERPQGLQRAPTGFDVSQDIAARKPSVDSAYSYQSEGISPVTSMKAPSLAPTREEEEDSRPRALQRTATGWSEHTTGSNEEQPPLPPRVSEAALRSMPGDARQKDISDDKWYSQRIIHQMRVDEGKALHEARRREAESTRRGSESSGDSFRPGSVQSGSFKSGTPPNQFSVPLAGKTPPRLPNRPPPRASEPDYDPYRARDPSPVKRKGPHDVHPIDTNPRPPSSESSHYNIPSGSSSARGPMSSADPLSAASRSLQRQPIGAEKTTYTAFQPSQSYSLQQREPVSAASQSSVLPTPPQYERKEYMEGPRASPPHAYRSARSPDTTDALSCTKQDERAPKPPVHSDTKSQGEVALADFSERVQHMKGIFLLTAQLGGQIHDHTPMEWLRVASWWFLKGRAGMEAMIRARPKDGGAQPERLTQAHVDLAKAWWIATEIIHDHPTLRRYGDRRMETQSKFAREAGDVLSTELYEAYDAMLFSLKMLLGSMRRHQSMPPTQALIQGQDQSIWVEYPKFAPDAHSVLAGTASRTVMTDSNGHQFNAGLLMPLGDTKSDFCYFRMFATVSMSTDSSATDRVPLPVVISALRPKDQYRVKLAICSQTELINVVVASNPELGPTWRDVAWNSQARAITIALRHGFRLNVELSEQDFRSLWTMVDHTNRVESNLRERADERLSSKMYLRDVSYTDSSNPGAFPQGRVPTCKLLVFQKFERSSEGTGKRKLHRGHRLVVVTNPKSRTLSCVSHELGTNQEPINFEYIQDQSDGAPGLTLRFKEETQDKRPKRCKMSMFFTEPADRNQLFGTFTSMNQEEDEEVFAQVPLKGFSIESADQAEGFSQSGGNILKRLQWMEAKALNKDPETLGMDTAPTVMSESLRIVCRHSKGVISDRMNLGPGDLLVRLPIDGAAELILLRNPQHDMAVAIDASRAEKDAPEALADLLKTLTNASTIRKLTFNSYSDLHTFQLAVTGFQVLFDG
ncbi:hypothetical protein M011DRAFT_528938 [Sporormia fimetaria CBS 119925]|uniref:Uncharacterized protein n=1 Tax=Sporormia fimetaria CBS 119925 TaxID=1340428 RepID=A0A6A6V3R5_9PLEO|nr:hypothetical protein M011DRAFT_528938 [Sporormia fimetaria CBS 119925]